MADHEQRRAHRLRHVERAPLARVQVALPRWRLGPQRTRLEAVELRVGPCGERTETNIRSIAALRRKDLRSRNKAPVSTPCHAMVRAKSGAHRPRRARDALQPRVVHSKRQTSLAAAIAARGQGANTQRIIEVGRVYLRALKLCAHAQSCSRGVVSASPEVSYRPEARTILQAHAVIHVIERANLCCVWAQLATHGGVGLLKCAIIEHDRTRAVDCGID